MRRTGALILALVALPAFAAPKNDASQKGGETASIFPSGGAKGPISIDADTLDYFQKESRAVYNGHVVVTQGDSRLACSKLTIFMEPNEQAGSGKKASPEPSPQPASATPAATPGDATASSKLNHMDCAGPVTVTSKTQTATADNGSYDKGHNNIVLTGHVVLTDGRNTTKGDRLIYDLATGKAAVQGGSSRVRGVFIPGSADATDTGKRK